MSDQQGPQQWATVLVGRWENDLGVCYESLSDPLGLIAHLNLTQDVKDRMRDDIVALINDVITREHNTPNPSHLENELIGILSTHVGETGESEGAVAVLKRLEADHYAMSHMPASHAP